MCNAECLCVYAARPAERDISCLAGGKGRITATFRRLHQWAVLAYLGLLGKKDCEQKYFIFTRTLMITFSLSRKIKIRLDIKGKKHFFALHGKRIRHANFWSQI